MDYVGIVKRLYRDVYDGSQRSVLQRLGRSLDRSKSLEVLLENDDPALDPFPAEYLAKLADAHRAAVRWKAAAKEVRRSLAKSGLQLPDGSLQMAATPHELGALERAGRMCQRSGYPNHDAWAAAVGAHVELWRACVEIGLKQGSVSIEISAPDHEDADQFANLVESHLGLEEIRSYRWLGARRGERAGVLAITLEVPWDEVKTQTDARLTSLGLSAQKRGAASVLDELVSNELEPILRALLDRRAEEQALESARTAYTGLLETPALKANVVLAIHVGTERAPTGMAVLDRAGELLAQDEVKPDGDLEAAITSLIETHTPEAAVLPVSSPDDDRLRAVESGLGETPVTRVHTAALGEARDKLSFPKMVAGAIVLGRRALRPAREWSRVDPASLGLGEYPREIPTERLSEALIEARKIAAWSRAGGKRRSAGKGRAGATATRPARLNPAIRAITDLRPGMTVDGVITNLTRFGAFVNIGLATEGMIHISQLSTEFVEDPAQVVRIGQAVNARVLEVVPEKSRIALSLKPAIERPEFPPRDGKAGPPRAPAIERSRRGGDRGGDKKSRSAALADLDALFKK
ncbi:MAG: S1 RNA-binding domain-containing protein [Deltaproteobacteria bacterium]|nr:S1 RNA-binding domain-containing protein [Deltaproteobacteria bacterium]